MQEKIKAIMDKFDFKKVHDYMRSSGWVWCKEKDHGMEIPSIERIKTVALELLNDVSKEKTGKVHVSRTGGFVANSIQFEHETEPTLTLSFNIESIQSF